MKVKRSIRLLLSEFRWLTSWARVLPGFLIIGGSRCGTTSLYYNLLKHPQVSPCFTKEVHFFDINFRKGRGWYRSHFQTLFEKFYSEAISGMVSVTGEATPHYLFHPFAPRRVREVAPQVKLIALLRNPIDRAYSHHSRRAHARRGNEKLSFMEAVEREGERLALDIQRMGEDEFYSGSNHRWFSYLARGRYIEQLEKWFKFFPRNQMLIIKSEDFFTEPGMVFDKVTDFLGISKWKPILFERYNVGSYNAMDTEMRAQLQDYFKPYNCRLYKFLGTDFDWK